MRGAPLAAAASGVSAMSSSSSGVSSSSSSMSPAVAGFDATQTTNKPPPPVVTPSKLQELLKQIDPVEKLDPEVEEVHTHVESNRIEWLGWLVGC